MQLILFFNMNKFEQLGLQAEIVNAVNDMGFEAPSEVQAQAIPILLDQETDLVALAQTGTGKTAAFGFPLIQKINVDRIGLYHSTTRYGVLTHSRTGFFLEGPAESGLTSIAI